AHVGGELLVAVDVESDELGKLLRAPPADIVVERRYLIAHLGIAQGLVGEFVPARDDGVRRSRRSRQSAPGNDLEAGIAELRHGRHFGEPWRALEACGRKGPQPAAGDVL